MQPLLRSCLRSSSLLTLGLLMVQRRQMEALSRGINKLWYSCECVDCVPSRSRLGPTKTQCYIKCKDFCSMVGLLKSQREECSRIGGGKSWVCWIWLCTLGCKSGCSTTRKRASNPGTVWNTCTLRHCKDEKLGKKLCAEGEPGCRPGNQSANLYQVSVKSTPPHAQTLLHVRESLVFWVTFLVTWCGVAPRSERSNQILDMCMT